MKAIGPCTDADATGSVGLAEAPELGVDTGHQRVGF